MTGDALVHRALLYGTDEEFLATAVPFVRAGLTAGDVVLAVVMPARLAVLRDTLGDEAGRVRLIDASRFYRHPVRAVAAYDECVRTHAPRPVRVVGEIDWPALTAAQTTEWMRYEALVNVAFNGYDGAALCCYDARVAAPPVLRAVRRTHPVVLTGPGSPAVGPADAYTDPRAFAAELDRAPLPPPPAGAESRPVVGDDLADLRAFVAARATGHGMARRAVTALLVAVTEIATNAVRHGTPPVTLRVWAEREHLICEVRDHGDWRPDPFVGFVPPDGVPRLGLWGVRMLTDLVEVRADPAGTIVRLHSRLRPDARGDAPVGRRAG